MSATVAARSAITRASRSSSSYSATTTTAKQRIRCQSDTRSMHTHTPSQNYAHKTCTQHEQKQSQTCFSAREKSARGCKNAVQKSQPSAEIANLRVAPTCLKKQGGSWWHANSPLCTDARAERGAEASGVESARRKDQGRGAGCSNFTRLLDVSSLRMEHRQVS